MSGRIPAGSAARVLLVAATLVLALQRPARAQYSTTQRNGWIVGPLIGQPGAGAEAYVGVVTLGVGITRLVPNRPGLDLAVGMLPQAIAYGVIPFAARIGPSIPLAMGPNAFFIPSAGVSAIAVIPSDGIPVGVYGGGAVVVAHGSVGFRAGVTWHQLPNSEPPLWLVEVGVMHVPRPRRAR